MPRFTVKSSVGTKNHLGRAKAIRLIFMKDGMRITVSTPTYRVARHNHDQDDQSASKSLIKSLSDLLSASQERPNVFCGHRVLRRRFSTGKCFHACPMELCSTHGCLKRGDFDMTLINCLSVWRWTCLRCPRKSQAAWMKVIVFAHWQERGVLLIQESLAAEYPLEQATDFESCDCMGVHSPTSGVVLSG